MDQLKEPKPCTVYAIRDGEYYAAIAYDKELRIRKIDEGFLTKGSAYRSAMNMAVYYGYEFVDTIK